MRIRVEQDGLSVRAIAGSEVVLFGIDIDPALIDRLLGFGFERTNDDTGSRQPLYGLKTFASTRPSGHRAGKRVSTLNHPVQGFLWGDYEADPGIDYTYRVVALGGAPDNLVPLAEVQVPVQTETPSRGRHGIWFNRGVIGSQQYASRFRNKHPGDVAGRRAWKWLSRGLEEALHAFIGRALPGDAIRAAFYEFQEPRALDAFRQAVDRGADVRIVIDAKDKESGPREENLEAIHQAGLADAVVLRETGRSAISHNKFIVHLRAGQPIAVWTGSTNLTVGGVFGHSNVGHAVRVPAVARHYLEEWERLARDPTRATLVAAHEQQAVPGPETLPTPGISTIFSPRRSEDILDWYAWLITQARQAVFITAPFGFSEKIERAIAGEGEALHYGLLNRRDSTMDVINRSSSNSFAAGAFVSGRLEGVLTERDNPLNRNDFVHNKFLLVDVLGDDPIVVTGSANFSPNSTTTHDENMLVIRGDERVADIYLTEFMRMFNHFLFRHLANRTPPPVRAATSGEPPTRSRMNLDEMPGWAWKYFSEGFHRTAERRLFGGRRSQVW